MRPVEFTGQNVILAKDQPEYTPLPAMLMPDGLVITCWELSEEEKAEIAETGKIYLQQLTFNQPLQPVLLLANLADGIELK